VRASRDADTITGFGMDLERERAPASIDRVPRIERRVAPPMARKTLAEAK